MCSSVPSTVYDPEHGRQCVRFGTREFWSCQDERNKQRINLLLQPARRDTTLEWRGPHRRCSPQRRGPLGSCTRPQVAGDSGAGSGIGLRIAGPILPSQCACPRQALARNPNESAHYNKPHPKRDKLNRVATKPSQSLLRTPCNDHPTVR